MAVGVQLSFPQATLRQYDTINEYIGRLPGGPAAEHEIFHFVSPTDHGFRVVDVWESKEAFDQFFNDRLVPAFEEAAVSVPPSVEYFDIYDFASGPR